MNVLNLLAITATGNFPDPDLVLEEKTKTAVILISLAVIALSVFFARFFPELSGSFAEKKKASERKKTEKKREEELERLHRIKEKNKRK